MRRIKLWAAAAAMFGLSLIGNAFGQTAGEEVVVVAKQTELKHETTVVKTIYRGSYLTVRDTNGKWLWVESSGTRGWLNKDHVIPVSEAIDHFTEELRRNSKDADALVARAKAWQRKGELTNAVRDCTDAIAIDPKWKYPYAVRCDAYDDLGQHDNAIADLTEVIRLDPKDAWAYGRRASAFRETKRYDRAIVDYTEAIRLNPKDESAYNMRGLTHRELKQYDKAIADHSEAIRLAEHKACALNNRSLAYENLKQFDRAIADLTEAIQREPEFTLAYMNRARMHKDQQRFDLAIVDYAEVIRIKPTHARAHFDLARLLATSPSDEVRDGKRAIELAKKAVELTTENGKANPYVLTALAAAYAEVGDFDQAVKVQTEALADTPSEKKADLEVRLKLYEAGQPYRDVPKTEVATTTVAK